MWVVVGVVEEREKRVTTTKLWLADNTTEATFSEGELEHASYSEIAH